VDVDLSVQAAVAGSGYGRHRNRAAIAFQADLAGFGPLGRSKYLSWLSPASPERISQWTGDLKLIERFDCLSPEFSSGEGLARR
jgi:hypothetical protein